MARPNRKQAEATASTTDNTEEAPVTETTPTEAPEAEVTETETPEAETEVVIDLTGFKAAVETAMSEADTSTGQLPESAFGPVNDEYRKLDGQKPKNAARLHLEESMLAAVGELDAVKARGYSELRGKLSAGGGAAKDKAPADPTAAFVQRVAAQRLALSLVEGSVDDKVATDWSEQADKQVGELAEQVASYKTWLETETPEGEEKPSAPEVSAVVRQAFKLSSGKGSGARVGGGSSSGVRRNTGKHIAEAFAEQEVGAFLTIAEIAKFRSTEYGDEAPSQGAISARLFPSTTVEGVEPVEKGAIDGKNPKGARKIAAA